jgi:hypothetical protein
MKMLIIKGDKFQAARAAADRGILLAYVEQVWSKFSPATIGKTNADVERLNAWFVEDKQGPPFPVGSLLHWGEWNV